MFLWQLMCFYEMICSPLLPMSKQRSSEVSYTCNQFSGAFFLQYQNERPLDGAGI